MTAGGWGRRDGLFETFLHILKRAQAPRSEGSGTAYDLCEVPQVDGCDARSAGRMNMMVKRVRQYECCEMTMIGALFVVIGCYLAAKKFLARINLINRR